ncbi:hypothetical protein GFS60_04414 [Rhodococcus sp. WAY2]|nr:hypothetical protein GFS60_04414 [Rhodococcus sp. WAY2]
MSIPGAHHRSRRLRRALGVGTIQQNCPHAVLNGVLEISDLPA